MTAQMDWSHDYCLTCDCQIAEGNYCSQACRLAEMEKANAVNSAASNLSTSASSTSSSHGFYLPPAVNFSALKTPAPSRGFELGPSSPHYYSTASTNGTYMAAAGNQSHSTNQSQQRSLTPSSSQSSLTSSSSQTNSGISVQAARQLNNYVRSFDQVRDMKRRYTHY